MSKHLWDNFGIEIYFFSKKNLFLNDRSVAGLEIYTHLNGSIEALVQVREAVVLYGTWLQLCETLPGWSTYEQRPWSLTHLQVP